MTAGEQRPQVCDAGSQHSTELELQQAPYYQDESGESEVPRTGLFWEAVALSKENPRRVNDLGSGKLVAAPSGETYDATHGDGDRIEGPALRFRVSERCYGDGR